MVNRPPDPRPDTVDGGRTILEAVVALALIAIAVTSWGRLSVSSARVESSVAAREVALELATNTLERLHLREWDATAIDPDGGDTVRRFERKATVFDPRGVEARVVHSHDDSEFVVVTHITEAGNDAWRNAIVIVEWGDGDRTATLRLDSALRRPDTGSGG